MNDLTKMYAALAGKGSRRYSGTLAGQTILTVHMVVRAVFAFVCDVQKDFTVNPAATRQRSRRSKRPSRSAAWTWQRWSGSSR